MVTAEQRTLELEDADVVYDVRGPLPPGDGRPPLLMIGQPMDASGFADLASRFPERTVVTYDPRGLGRSGRRDGRTENDPEVQAEDVHRLIAELGAGPVDLFASSGGAVTALALVTAHPDDVRVLVAHEPPLLHLLPDASRALRVWDAVTEAYAARGWGAGMAGFIAMTSWRGEFTDDYLEQPTPDPMRFGLPTEDDGSRNDPLLAGSDPVLAYRPDPDALSRASTRVVLAAGEESAGTLTARATQAMAELLGQEPAVFPSHHGGFTGGEGPYAGQPAAFARRLREVLEGA